MRGAAQGRRGSVLAHVLVTAVIVAVIASGILRMVMMRYQGTARVQESARNTRNAMGGFNVLMSAWNTSGGGRSCTSVAGYTCVPASPAPPAAPICGCTCNSSTPGMPRIMTCAGAGGTCRVSACSAPFTSCVCPAPP